MHRARFERSFFRRYPGGAAGSHTTINGSGGAWTFLGPMITVDGGAQTIRYDNAKRIELTDAANVSTDASLGTIFDLSITANRTIDAPTNPTDGQKIIYRIKQPAGSVFQVTWNAIFNFGLTVPLSATTLGDAGVNSTDHIGFIYNAASNKWDCDAFAGGFT